MFLSFGLVFLCLYGCLMSGLQLLVDVVERVESSRGMTSLEVKVLAAMLCFAGLSYRGVAKAVGVYPMGLCVGLSQPLGVFRSLRGGCRSC